MRYGIYTEALELLAGTDKIALILDHYKGLDVPDHRLLWLTTLAIDQGYTPLVASYNALLDKYYVKSEVNNLYLYIKQLDVAIGEVTIFND